MSPLPDARLDFTPEKDMPKKLTHREESMVPKFAGFRRSRGKFHAFFPCLILSFCPVLPGAEAPSKSKQTPTFWQKDPEASFEGEGRMHCAPTAISAGLIYLSRTFGWKGLVSGTDHDSQIKIIHDLAGAFHTDPSIGGTNPDRILTGLQTHVKSKGFSFDRLEVMTWRGLSDANKKFKLGTKPGLAWMRKAASSKDTVVAFNFGWYHDGDDGHTRKGGHWVAVVGSDPDSAKFYIHNPALQPKD